jgi:hypothetical protein
MGKIRHPLLAALALAAAASSAQAQVIVRAPGVRVVVPARPALTQPTVLPPAVPVELSAPPAVPIDAAPARLVPPVVSAAGVPTVADFVSTFQPSSKGGRYEVVLLHPCTNCPVKVCFTLPCRCPKKVRCTKAGFEVRYGLCKAVAVRFLADGSVHVRD